MNRRRNFLRNVLMTAAISLLPKILHPSIGEVVEEMVEVTFNISYEWWGMEEGEIRMIDIAASKGYSFTTLVPKGVLPLIENRCKF